MILDKPIISAPSTQNKAPRWVDLLSIAAAVLAIVIGVAIAVSVGKYGTLVLLAIPGSLLLLSALAVPELGLMAFIAITCSQLSNVGISYHGYPSIAQPLAGLLFVLILLRITLYGERPLGWKRAVPILIVYFLVLFVSMLHAGDFQVASQTFISFFKDALGALIVVMLINKPGSYKAAIWALIAAGVFMATISVFQALTGTYSNEYWGFGGWTTQVSGFIGRYRVQGPYANPNAFAQILVVVVVLALDRFWHEKHFVLRAMAGYALVITILGVFFTYSRGGFLALFFAFGIFLVQHRPGFVPFLLTIFLAIGLIQFLPATYTERISSLTQFLSLQSDQVTDPSFRGRLSENTVAWQIFLDHPWLGIGIGNYAINYQDYSRDIGLDPRRTNRSPASLYLELLSEQGVVGTLVFFSLVALVFQGLWTSKRHFTLSGLRDESYISAALFAGIGGYMFSALFKNSAYSNAFWVIIGLAIAAAHVAWQSLENKTAERENSIGSPAARRLSE